MTVTGQRIGLVSCTKLKDPRSKFAKMPAEQVYEASQLFRAAVTHIKRQDAGYFILSALHGLISPDKPIRHYDETLNGRSKEHLKAWAQLVYEQMIGLSLIGCGHVWEVHAGSDYSTHLVRLLKRAGESVEQPVRGLTIGRRRGWYKSAREAAQPVTSQRSLLTEMRPPVARATPVCGRKDVDPEAPLICLWPCVGTGPGVVMDKTGLYRPMPAPPLSGWRVDRMMSGNRVAIREWLHPRPVTRPAHERESTIAAVVRWCALSDRWLWSVLMPRRIGGPCSIPAVGGAACMQDAKDAADSAISNLEVTL